MHIHILYSRPYDSIGAIFTAGHLTAELLQFLRRSRVNPAINTAYQAGHIKFSAWRCAFMPTHQRVIRTVRHRIRPFNRKRDRSTATLPPLRTSVYPIFGHSVACRMCTIYIGSWFVHRTATPALLPGACWKQIFIEQLHGWQLNIDGYVAQTNRRSRQMNAAGFSAVSKVGKKEHLENLHCRIKASNATKTRK